MNTSFEKSASIVFAFLTITIAGCQKQEPPPQAAGPAEKAGREIDKAAAKAAVELNKVGEQVGKTLQKAGQSLESRSKDAQEKSEKNEKN